MRLWHYKLIPVLPKQQLVSQWRECIAIKRQWEKGTLKHRLVSYVMNHDKEMFLCYVRLVIEELNERKIKYNIKLFDELFDFCYSGINTTLFIPYPEHNDRYLKQCFYNLEEKYDRGIISEEEWKEIEFLRRFGKPKSEMKFEDDGDCEWCGGRLYENYICSECGLETECK